MCDRKEGLFSIYHLTVFVCRIYLIVVSCDFVDHSSFLSQANDPRSHTKQHEVSSE